MTAFFKKPFESFLFKFFYKPKLNRKTLLGTLLDL